LENGERVVISTATINLQMQLVDKDIPLVVRLLGRDPGHFLLLVWLAVILQGGIWSVDFEAPQAHRTFGLTPAVAMLAALPVGLLWRLAGSSEREPHPAAARRWPTRLAVWALAGTAAVVTAIVVVESGPPQLRDLGNQLRRADVWPDYSADATLVAHQLLRLGTDHEVWVAPALLEHPAIEFHVPAAVRGRAHTFQWQQDLPARSDGAAAYFFEGTKQESTAGSSASIPRAASTSTPRPRQGARLSSTRR
jgi:hypothetical protein